MKVKYGEIYRVKMNIYYCEHCGELVPGDELEDHKSYCNGRLSLYLRKGTKMEALDDGKPEDVEFEGGGQTTTLQSDWIEKVEKVGPPPKCPFCLDASGVIKKGKDNKGRQRYYCKDCKSSFVDRVGEELTEKEFRYFVENTIVELLCEWEYDEVNVKNRTEHSLFQKLPKIPVGDTVRVSGQYVIEALAKVLNVSVRQAKRILYKVVVELLREA